MKQPGTILAAVAGSLTAMPAFAADEGLPQFNMALYPEQLFWLFVSFGILYLLMHFVALPGVEHVQDKRQQVIDTDLNIARTANEQAKAASTAADKAMSEARAKAQATINGIKTESSKLAADEQGAQGKKLHDRLREAEAGIAMTRDGALKEIEGAAAGLADAIVEAVSGLKVKA